MDEKTKKELTTNNGKLIQLPDYDVRLLFDDGDKTWFLAKFYKKTKNKLDTHTGKFTDDEIETLIQDIKDLSDWRHYRRLKNKLNS